MCIVPLIGECWGFPVKVEELLLAKFKGFGGEKHGMMLSQCGYIVYIYNYIRYPDKKRNSFQLQVHYLIPRLKASSIVIAFSCLQSSPQRMSIYIREIII